MMLSMGYIFPVAPQRNLCPEQNTGLKMVHVTVRSLSSPQQILPVVRPNL